ncbi:MAG TPA: PTS sugar transporter subunit IIB [Bacillus sp. (in: firmicutes)]|uniref:PTS sugar transporter subunit IIB n=1 Tax=Bacillus litorisediminis TaxID=2922713 RepID=UPI001FAC6D2D|nr:PTS sugar transporter subunit IIB [Bacillus litorisediminis]HWO76191.1 PTS sugar transporter subunit IIB [Bacillus sp. (in: firmicutes)]
MKILCVCGLGQGTSLILRINVETVLRELGVQADVDNTDVSSASSENPDFIITSNELAQSLEGHSSKIIIVNNYFDMNEIKTALKSNL